MTQKRGVLIILEGIDQSGKSSATKRISEILNSKNIPTITQPFPDRSTEIGQLIDAFLHGKNLPQQAVHLLYSANRWEVSQKIIKTLQSGTNVICDRYAFSGIVYSIANGLDEKWCLGPDSGLPMPDEIFYLELELEEAERRRKTMQTDRYENIQFQKKVKMEYEKLRDRMKWTSVDATLQKEELAQKIVGLIEKRMEENQFKEIETLELM